MPSRGLPEWQAVTSTIVSPIRTITEPCACLAHLPVSIVRERPPNEISLLCIGTLRAPRIGSTAPKAAVTSRPRALNVCVRATCGCRGA